MNDDEFRALAEEKAALRRVATLVAGGMPPKGVFEAVTEEVAKLLSVDYAALGHYGSDATCTLVARSGNRSGHTPLGQGMKLGGRNINTLVFETGRPTRMDSYSDASGTFGRQATEDGVGSGVGTRVIVEGHLWGVMSVYSHLAGTLPGDTEARLVSFAELLGTAIANSEGRAELAQLAEEQTALRRVATLVAQGAPPEEVFHRGHSGGRAAAQREPGGVGSLPG